MPVNEDLDDGEGWDGEVKERRKRENGDGACLPCRAECNMEGTSDLAVGLSSLVNGNRS